MNPNWKWVCTECRRWHGLTTDLLAHPNPFNATETLYFCPHCHDCCELRQACDEPECWQPATGGTPTPRGYRSLCNEHYRALVNVPNRT